MTYKNKVTFDFDVNKVKKRYKNKYNIARLALKNEVVKDTEPYVPFETGTIARSAYQSIRGANDRIVYKGPAARFLYYGYVMVGITSGKAWANKGETKRVTGKKLVYGSAHPLAGAKWFEKSKKIYVGKWLKVAKRGFRNGY